MALFRRPTAYARVHFDGILQRRRISDQILQNNAGRHLQRVLKAVDSRLVFVVSGGTHAMVTDNQRARVIRDSLLDFLREMKREAPWLHPLDTYQMSEGNGLQDPGSLHSDHFHLSEKGSIFYVEVVRMIKELLQKVRRHPEI